MNHTLITNYVIKDTSLAGETDRTAGYTKEKGLGLSERAGRLRDKGRSCAIVNTVSYEF